MQHAGLLLLARNYRSPGRAGGDIGLILRDPRDGAVVLLEVRQRTSASHGGAGTGASITGLKQRRIVFAARHDSSRLRTPPPCCFDVVPMQERVEWPPGAFDAG